MAKRDNFFALLDDDDEGVDLMTLVARAEAKAAAAPAVGAAATDGVTANQSQRASADQGKMVRERGRRGHYQLSGHGGPLFEEADGNGVEGQSTDGFTKVYRGDSAARSRRGRGRGGGSRGRGRGFYVERTFGNASHFYNTENQGQNGDVNEDVTEEQTKGDEYRSNRPSRYEKSDGKIGDENRNSGFKEHHGFRSVERRNYSGDNQPVRGGQGYGGNRGFRGGEYRDENGYDENGYQRERRGYGNVNRRVRGEAQRYVRHNEAQVGGEVKKNENAEEVKEDAAAGKDQGANNVNNGENGSGWDMPEATEAVTDGKTENRNTEKKTEEDEEDRRKRMEAEEEAKKMTLIEYEKVLQEKRKALEATRNEAKRVVDEKEFEGMQLVEKKKEEELFVKLKMDKEKQKKKEGVEREEKARKSSVSINVEYYGGRGRARGRGQHGRYRGGHRLPDAPAIEDPSQFPILGQAVKA